MACSRPLTFSHVIDSEKKLDGMKELIESVILSLYSVRVSTKAYSWEGNTSIYPLLVPSWHPQSQDDPDTFLDYILWHWSCTESERCSNPCVGFMCELIPMISVFCDCAALKTWTIVQISYVDSNLCVFPIVLGFSAFEIKYWLFNNGIYTQ